MTNIELLKIKKYLSKGRIEKFDVWSDDLVDMEKKRRIKNIVLPNGKFFILPIDQGLEHGPVDFLVNPYCGSPEFQLDLATEVGFSAIAMQFGLAKRYWRKLKYRKNISLIVKINGKTQVPKVPPFSVANATVSEAIDLGADVIGYTLYVGSERQDEDIKQFAKIRKEANKQNIPVIVWAYPRGEQITINGGKDSVAAVEYAVRVAMEMGADMVKYNLPKYPIGGFDEESIFAKYNSLEKLDQKQRLQKVTNMAGSMGTLLSGGNLTTKKDTLEHVKLAMECGVDGIIFGRNVWKREYNDALDLAKKMKKIILSY